MKLTVYHDGQYWVGVLEDVVDGKLKAARYLFGAEPYDWDVMRFVNTKMLGCLNAATAQLAVKVPVRPANPKRLARQAAKEAAVSGVSTFAQAAIKLDYAARKAAQAVESKQRKEALADYKYAVKVQKAKEKKRGH